LHLETFFRAICSNACGNEVAFLMSISLKISKSIWFRANTFKKGDKNDIKILKKLGKFRVKNCRDRSIKLNSISGESTNQESQQVSVRLSLTSPTPFRSSRRRPDDSILKFVRKLYCRAGCWWLAASSSRGGLSCSLVYVTSRSEGGGWFAQLYIPVFVWDKGAPGMREAPHLKKNSRRTKFHVPHCTHFQLA
jgi:hypothetical protein